MSTECTHEEHQLFVTATYKDHPFHHDGTFAMPRVSQAIAEMIANEWDLVNFMENRKPSDMIPEPQSDVRERAEFLFGLSTMLKAMFAIGQVEHTNDWDWFVQVQTADGTWYGDYYKDGKAQDWEVVPDDEIIYCDTFCTDYDEDSYHQMGIVPEAQEYYANLTITLQLWGGGRDVDSVTLKVGDLSKIIISQR